MEVFIIIGLICLAVVAVVNGFIGAIMGEKPGGTGRTAGDMFLRAVAILRLGIVGIFLDRLGLGKWPRYILYFTAIIVLLSVLRRWLFQS